MWKYDLLDFCCNTPALLFPPSPNNVYIYTIKKHRYFYLCYRPMALLDHCKYQASLLFNCMKQNFFYFFFISSINAPLKIVWFILIGHCILLDFKKNIFKWNLYAAKMLLLTLKTITLKYILNRKGLV